MKSGPPVSLPSAFDTQVFIVELELLVLIATNATFP